MFGPRLPGLSIGTVIGGLSKTLGLVNQAIPLYKQVSPMISNARNAIKSFQTISTTSVEKTMQNINKNVVPEVNKIKEIKTLNQTKGPTFFQ